MIMEVDLEQEVKLELFFSLRSLSTAGGFYVWLGSGCKWRFHYAGTKMGNDLWWLGGGFFVLRMVEKSKNYESSRSSFCCFSLVFFGTL